MAVDKDKLEEDASIARFYKIVLSWDYFVREKSKDSKDGFGMAKVKDTYKDVDDYISTYEPLLLEEAKAQIIEDELGDAKERCVVECTEVDGFHLAVLTSANDMDGNKSVSQNDLLLLSKQKYKKKEKKEEKDKTTEAKKEEEKDKTPTIYAFALVESRQPRGFQIRMYLSGEVTNSKPYAVKSCSRLLNMKSLVTSSSERDRFFYTYKICSLSTITREYVSLRSIGSLPIKDIILGASERNIDSEGQSLEISRPLEEFLKDNLNESQQNAIQAGLSRKPVILIQGPPGTGKTQTILGILSAILHATPARLKSRGGLPNIKRRPRLSTEKFKHWRLASPWLTGSNCREEIMPVNGDDGFFPTTGNELKPEVVICNRKFRVRVLVCAPSNTALDEIVGRVLKTGLRDEGGRSYNPKIVRIGVKAHHSVHSVSMDELVELKKASTGGGKERDGGADRFRSAILEEAIIVFSTLSFSGSTLFSKWSDRFDVVIIDEAAQAVEPATLVPLTNGCKQVFLVGDPAQLAATVKSPIAKNFGYGTSLFERFQRAGYPVTMLKMQYRMHPEIRSFPSAEFYAESLEDGPNIEERTKRSWHEYRCFGPLCFFDLQVNEKKKATRSPDGSWMNDNEVNFVMLLHHKLVSTYPELKSSDQLAIISPYRAQIDSLKQRFRSTYGVEYEKLVEITTVDGCQGREKDVAIFSCVTEGDERNMKFVGDFRRINVGITRAKSSILVVGSASALRKNKHWNNLVESAKKRGRLLEVPKDFDSFFSDENMKSFAVKEESSSTEAVRNDDVDNYAPSDNLWDVDQAQGDDNDFGVGDMDMDGATCGDD